MNNFPKYYVYKLIFKSGATYVGQHTQKSENDKYISSSGYLKHHPDDTLINRQILIYLPDRDLLDIFETILICQDKAENPKNVNYNLGQWATNFYRGGWNKGIPNTEKQRHKISEKLKGRKPWNKGKTLSDEHKRKIGEASKGNHYTLGFKHTDETKRKMSESHKGKPHSKEWNKKVGDAQRGKPKSKESIEKVRLSSLKYYKRVKCIEDNLEFESMKECSRYYGVASIEACIKNRNGFFKKINKHFIFIS